MAFDSPVEREITIELLSIYKKRYGAIETLLRSSVVTDAESSRLGDLQRGISREIRNLNREVSSWSRSAVSSSYKFGKEEAERLLSNSNELRGVNVGTRQHSAAIRAISSDLALELRTTNTVTAANLRRAVFATQQEVISDFQIGETIREQLLAGGTQPGARDVIHTKLLKALDEGKLITAGSKTYTPEAYANLVSRTVYSRSVVEGNLNTSVANGIDLVKVPWHFHDNRPVSDVCGQYHGRTYSISGNDSRFPKLAVKPPFHPNCKHKLHPVSERILRIRGEIDEESKRSKKKGNI